jgi:hypothetical protein
VDRPLSLVAGTGVLVAVRPVHDDIAGGDQRAGS